MSTGTEEQDKGSQARESYIRVQGLGRDDKLALEEEVATPGAEYFEASWRKTSKESLGQIRREIDRMRGIDPDAQPSRRRKARGSTGPKVPPGVRSRVTDKLGPIAETEVVYTTKRRTVIRAVLLEEDRRRVLLLIDDDGVREVEDVERVVDEMPEGGHPRPEAPVPPVDDDAQDDVSGEVAGDEDEPPVEGGGLHWRGWTQKYEQPIDGIEGIGDEYARQLKGKGIDRIGDMVLAGQERVERMVDAPSKTVSKWFAMADLMRVKDVGTQFSELLMRAGVASVEDLADRDPDKLTEALHEYQESVDVTIQGAPIHKARVAGWVATAKRMTRTKEE